MKHNPQDQFCKCQACVERHAADLAWIAESEIGEIVSLYGNVHPLSAGLKAAVQAAIEDAGGDVRAAAQPKGGQ